MFLGTAPANSSWDSERLNLEISMQRRVEEALGKILPQGQFVVVVRVEPWTQPIDGSGQPIEEESEYFLPGVPQKTNFDGTAGEVRKLVNTLKPDSPMFRRFIRRVSATLVLDQDINEDTVEKVRELTRQLLGLDPQRGDTLEIQRTGFQKPVLPVVDNSGISRLQQGLKSYWLIISLSLIVFCVTVFFLFVFGPLRGFLNRFVQVLPTLKPNESPEGRIGRFGGEMPMFPPMMGPYGYLPQPGGASPASFSGSLQVENPHKNTLPFGFIREDHLGNLAILLSRETPEKAAVVLGYLPPDWISRVLTKIEASMQSEIAAHLATTRQLLPEQVEDIEQDLKRRLDYLVGGPDRIFAIYESLDSEAQRRMLDNLKETRPELVEEIRHRTMAFEDLIRLEPTALKAVLREVDLQTLVMSLRGVDKEFRTKILEYVSAGKAEIIREELELSDAPGGKATFEAQRKLILIAKRMEREGQIIIPQVESGVPSTRFAGSLRDSLKLPPGMKIEPAAESSPPTEGKSKEDIENRIKRFMTRRSADRERFSIEDTLPPEHPPTPPEG